jgi:2-polyprenyl-6-methoxyphenol hydroxylase-like FAD-dependent oxidoreductase
VPVSIATAQKVAFQWPTGVPGGIPVFVLGDAAASAHYRLGIGINSGLSSMLWLHAALQEAMQRTQEGIWPTQIKPPAAAMKSTEELMQRIVSEMFSAISHCNTHTPFTPFTE